MKRRCDAASEHSARRTDALPRPLNALAVKIATRPEEEARGRDLYERALAAAEASQGPDSDLVARLSVNVGTALMNAGELERARPLVERGVVLHEQHFGPASRWTSYALDAQANLAWAGGTLRRRAHRRSSGSSSSASMSLGPTIPRHSTRRPGSRATLAELAGADNSARDEGMGLYLQVASLRGGDYDGPLPASALPTSEEAAERLRKYVGRLRQRTAPDPAQLHAVARAEDARRCRRCRAHLAGDLAKAADLLEEQIALLRGGTRCLASHACGAAAPPRRGQSRWRHGERGARPPPARRGHPHRCVWRGPPPDYPRVGRRLSAGAARVRPSGRPRHCRSRDPALTRGPRRGQSHRAPYRRFLPIRPRIRPGQPAARRRSALHPPRARDGFAEPPRRRAASRPRCEPAGPSSIHAYGRAVDTPRHLRLLLETDERLRDDALDLLGESLLAEDAVYPATTPAVALIRGLVTDPRVPGRARLVAFLTAAWVAARDASGGGVEDLRRALTDLPMLFAHLASDPDPTVREAATLAITMVTHARRLGSIRASAARSGPRSRGKIGGWSDQALPSISTPSGARRRCCCTTTSMAACGPRTVLELASEIGYRELPTTDPEELGRWFTLGRRPQVAGAVPRGRSATPWR